VSSFQNFVSVQSATRTGIANIGASAVSLARAEGLDAHANAVVLRMQAVAA
jgi:histidinol dehydrogenase